MRHLKTVLFTAILGALKAAAQDGLVDSCYPEDLYYNLSLDENIEAAVPFCSSFIGVPQQTTTVTVVSSRPVPTATETYTVKSATIIRPRQAPPTLLPRQDDGEDGRILVYDDYVQYPGWLGLCPAESIAEACERFEILPGPDVTVTETVLTPSLTGTLAGTQTAVARVTRVYARRHYKVGSPANVYDQIVFYTVVSADPSPNGEYSRAHSECQTICSGIEGCKVYFVVAISYGGRSTTVYCEIGNRAFDASQMSSSSSAVFSAGYELVRIDTSR